MITYYHICWMRYAGRYDCIDWYGVVWTVVESTVLISYSADHIPPCYRYACVATLIRQREVLVWQTGDWWLVRLVWAPFPSHSVYLLVGLDCMRNVGGSWICDIVNKRPLTSTIAVRLREFQYRQLWVFEWDRIELMQSSCRAERFFNITHDACIGMIIFEWSDH